MAINWSKLRDHRTKILFNALLDDELTRISVSKREENKNPKTENQLNTINNFSLKEFNKVILEISNTLLVEEKEEKRDDTYTTSLSSPQSLTDALLHLEKLKTHQTVITKFLK